MRSILILAGAICFLGFSGCQTARYVHRTATEGVVAIPSNQGWPNHREKAEKLMASHFPEGYVIDSEQECVVGIETNQVGHSGNSSWSTGTVTQDKTEWRINYRSRNSEQPQSSDRLEGYGKAEDAKQAVKQAAHQRTLDSKR